MVPRHTRRALLRASATAAIAGLAGCYFGPTDPRKWSSDPDSGQNVADGGSKDGNTQAADTPTPDFVRTYSIELDNRLTSKDLEPVGGVSADAPAKISLDVEAQYDDREETLFDRTFELPPGETCTVDDAFTTERGHQYVVQAKLEPFRADPGRFDGDYSAAYRFTPGGFGGPEGTRFKLLLVDTKDGDPFYPFIPLCEPGQKGGRCV